MVSETELDLFNTNGFLVIKDFLSKQICGDLIERMNQLITENEMSIPDIAFSVEDNAHAKEAYFKESYNKAHFFLDPNAFDEQGNLKHPLSQSINKVGHGLHVVDPVFKKVSFDKRIKKICLQLRMSAPSLLQSMYIFKQPKFGDKVNWHQDSTYLYQEDSDVIGFWFALEDATKENGCLQAIPSLSTTDLRERMISTEQGSEFIKFSDKPFDESQRVFLEVPQGSLIMLHGRLPHASGPNFSEQSRHAYALHLIDGDKKYSKENWLQWPQGAPLL